VNFKTLVLLVFFLSLFTSALKAAPPSDRPVPEDGGPTKIYCTLAILDIDQINDVEQSFAANFYLVCKWKDPREAHGQSTTIVKSPDEIWHPQLIILNRQLVWPAFSETVEISPEGEVMYRQNYWGDFSQPLDLYDFPLDRQTFEIKVVESGSSPEGDIEILQNPEWPSFLADDFSITSWKILGSKISTATHVLPTGDKLPAISMLVTAKRQLTHYVMKIIAPLLMILSLSWVVFWLDPKEGGSQLGVAVTTCLTVIAFHMSLTAELPKIQYLTRLDVFVFGATLMVFLAMIEVVVTTQLARTGREVSALKLDRISRVVFPSMLALVLLYAFLWR